MSHPRVVALAGPRFDEAITNRAIAAGVGIAPHRVNDRIEAAAPIRYGGSIIGALAARWGLGTPHDLSRAPTILATAAAAAAPLVRAALAVRSSPPSPATLELLGTTSAVTDLRRAVEAAGPAPFPVLIQGESGVGKELVARAVHRSGPRRHRAFCALNCAALPEELVEAELFGHARGAFTGAVTERSGVFEEAHGGTLFLDEVGELSLRAQAKLLRVVQEGEIRRLGENVARRVDVRLVTATNRDLRDEAAAGRYRRDLLYRLDVVRIVVPPLRDRREDIALLAEHFWAEVSRRIGSRATLGEAAMAALVRYDWPGNVRELQNVLAALAVRCPRRGVVPASALPPNLAGAPPSDAGCRLAEARRTFEERFVRAALVRSGGCRTRAAGQLGVTRQGLAKLIARLGIDA
jgi:transcriptional regulator with GAF, ATPase, and Fis domain